MANRSLLQNRQLLVPINALHIDGDHYKKGSNIIENASPDRRLHPATLML